MKPANQLLSPTQMHVTEKPPQPAMRADAKPLRRSARMFIPNCNTGAASYAGGLKMSLKTLRGIKRITSGAGRYYFARRRGRWDKTTATR